MIIEGRNKNIAFGELKDGDVFLDSGTYYLKIPPCTGRMGYDCNSYDLEVNDYCYFSCDREVTFVKAKLVIE